MENNSYKMICIDVDGTLLNNRHRITERTKEVILQAHRSGAMIVVSTGRMYTDAEHFSNLIGVRSPVIASNGAFIKDKDNDKVLYKNVLNEDLCLELLNIFYKHNMSPYFCTPDTFYYGNFMYKLYYMFSKLLGARDNSIDARYVFSRSRWKEVLEKEKENVVKCELIYRDTGLIADLRDELQGIGRLEVVDSSRYNIEITGKGVSKGKAIEMLAALNNIKREEIMAIGDSANDLSMIEYAGLGVAMGNAPQAVREKANYVTSSNDNDGVANAIAKFVLNESIECH